MSNHPTPSKPARAPAHRKPAPDDVEARGAAHNNGESSRQRFSFDRRNNKNEYETLRGFISGGGAQSEPTIEDEPGSVEPPRRPWWKFWKSKDIATTGAAAGKPPREWLDTDINQGISDSEVQQRRRRFGWNELKVEQVNRFRKFLGYFQGPILYGRLPLPLLRYRSKRGGS
jgi:H+-transporting ATPase